MAVRVYPDPETLSVWLNSNSKQDSKVRPMYSQGKVLIRYQNLRKLKKVLTLLVEYLDVKKIQQNIATDDEVTPPEVNSFYIRCQAYLELIKSNE